MEYPDIPHLRETDEPSVSSDKEEAEEYEHMYKNMWMT